MDPRSCMVARRAVGALALVFVAGSGCSSSSDQRVESSSQEQSGEESNIDAGPGMGVRCERRAQASAADTSALTLPIIDSLSLSPVMGVPVDACNPSDYTCEQPVASATSDSDGAAELTVPGNFSGYFQQTQRNDYIEALYFMPTRRNASDVLSNFPLIASAAFGALALALGTSLDSERGHAMLIIEDCMGAAVGGISFTAPQADAASTQFYIRDQLPTSSATDTPPEGTGGFVNLPAGKVEISATDAKTGQVLNTVTALIRAGSITTVYMRPADES